MNAKYDFREGVRGKFYRADATLQLPVYLEPDVLAFLTAQAEEQGVSVDEFVNNLLKRDIGIIKTAG